jgi:hypothetical protein
MKLRSRLTNTQGQALLETVLIVPLVLVLILNALNLGYFFFVTVNLAAVTRTGAEYSVLGPGSPGTTNYPSAGTGTLSVASLMYQDLTGAVWNGGSATVKICTPSAGTTSGYANCVTCAGLSSCTSANGSSATSSLDPESSAGFVLNRVDVQYSFPPLIPGSPFNLVLLGSLYNSGNGQYTFYRHLEMRAM